MAREYDVNVKGLCTYTVEAKNKDEAKVLACDCLFNDDEFYGTEATVSECTIEWIEED